MNNDITKKPNKAKETETHELLDKELKIIFLNKLNERKK